jgi:hypothetical protein
VLIAPEPLDNQGKRAYHITDNHFSGGGLVQDLPGAAQGVVKCLAHAA